MKKTKTVLILAAVTGALLLGGCGSEKTKIYEQAGKDLSQGSYKYALEEYQSSIQNGVSWHSPIAGQVSQACVLANMRMR